MRADMAPEDELCRRQLSPEEQKQALELLAIPLRWDLLLERASDHQVFPLLYRSLRTLEFHNVRGEVRAQLTAD